MLFIVGVIIGLLAGTLIWYTDPVKARGGMKGSILLGGAGGFIGALLALILNLFSGTLFFSVYNVYISLFLSAGLGLLFPLLVHLIFQKDKGVKTPITGGTYP